MPKIHVEQNKVMRARSDGEGLVTLTDRTEPFNKLKLAPFETTPLYAFAGGRGEPVRTENTRCEPPRREVCLTKMEVGTPQDMRWHTLLRDHL